MKYLPIILLVLLVSCSSDPNKEPDTVTGAESEKISFPQFPNFPPSPFPATTKPTTEGSTETSTTPAATISKEYGTYWGTPNGGRPQFYFKKKMNQYPKTFKLVIAGCVNRTITNNGSRFEGSNGLVVKQSEVSGRGMAVVGPYGCVTQTAYVE